MKTRWLVGLPGVGISIVLGIIVFFFFQGYLATLFTVIFLLGGPLVFVLVPLAQASQERKENKLKKAVVQELGTSVEMQKCDNCGKLIPEDATICSYCGHDLLTGANVEEQI